MDYFNLYEGTLKIRGKKVVKINDKSIYLEENYKEYIKTGDDKDFKKWVKIHYKGAGPDSHYSVEDLQEWEVLYENIGSFRGVEAFIKEGNNGKGPYYYTIIRKLQKNIQNNS